MDRAGRQINEVARPDPDAPHDLLNPIGADGLAQALRVDPRLQAVNQLRARRAVHDVPAFGFAPLARRRRRVGGMDLDRQILGGVDILDQQRKAFGRPLRAAHHPRVFADQIAEQPAGVGAVRDRRAAVGVIRQLPRLAVGAVFPRHVLVQRFGQPRPPPRPRRVKRLHQQRVAFERRDAHRADSLAAGCGGRAGGHSSAYRKPPGDVKPERPAVRPAIPIPVSTTIRSGARPIFPLG